MAGFYYYFISIPLLLGLTDASTPTVIGIRTKDSVILSSPKARLSSVGANVLDIENDGIYPLSEFVAMTVCGGSSDVDELETAVKRSSIRYQHMHSSVLSPKFAATLCRNIITSRLRSSRPLNVGTLIGGWDSVMGRPELYWLDHLGTMHEMGFAAHGADSDLIFAQLDSRWRATNYSESDGLGAAEACWAIVGSRSVTKTGGFCTKSVSRAGIRRVWASRAPL
jgi:20S proteasome alpha/beta subunit